MEIFKFDLQKFGGGGGTTQTYEPSEHELELQRISADYANAVAPNALYLNDTAKNVLKDSLGTVQVDYNNLNNAAQSQIENSFNGINNIIDSNNTGTRATNQTLEYLFSDYDNLLNDQTTQGLTDLANYLSQNNKGWTDALKSSAEYLNTATNDANSDLAKYLTGNSNANQTVNNLL